jgi:hypothetical protein
MCIRLNLRFLLRLRKCCRQLNVFLPRACLINGFFSERGKLGIGYAQMRKIRVCLLSIFKSFSGEFEVAASRGVVK